MRTKSKLIIIVSSLMIALAAIPSFASEYTIPGASWEFDDETAIATWEKCDASTSYYVELYKNGKKVGKTKKVSGNRNNFTSTIVSSGIGRYVFNVYPVKGGPDYTEVSDVLQVDSEVMKGFRKNTGRKDTDLPYSVPSALGTDHWHQNPGESWSYYLADGTQIKNQFKTIGSYTYYFDKNGNTVSGWNYIGNHWYYFEKTMTNNMYPQAAMYVNCVTPDGYLVNGKGEWCVDGVPVTQKDFSKNKNQATYNGSQNKTKDITSCTITLKKESLTAQPNYAEPSGATNCDITSFSFDKPYEQWSIGSSVKITVNLQTRNGYRFVSGTKFSCSNASVYTKNIQGSDKATVVLSYVPGAKLDTPTGFIISKNDGMLTWDKVSGAKRYRIVIKEDKTQAVNEIITENEYPIDDYLYDVDDEVSVNVKVTAMPSENNKNIKESAAAEIADLAEFAASSGSDGSFEKDGSRLYYTDENGDYKTGWVQTGGYWYYYSPKNNAAVSGWFQDPESKLWYYFDKSSHKMLIGQRVIDGQTYFLNDGSVAGLPLGAWHEGHKF